MKHPSGLIALSLAASVLSACSGSEHPPAAQAGPRVFVTAVPVGYADAAERLEAGGVVAAQESAVVSSRIVSTIVAVRVRAGDRVRADDVLVTLDAAGCHRAHSPGKRGRDRGRKGSRAGTSRANGRGSRTPARRGVAQTHHVSSRAQLCHRTGTRRGGGAPGDRDRARRGSPGQYRDGGCQPRVGTGCRRSRSSDSVLYNTTRTFRRPDHRTPQRSWQPRVTWDAAAANRFGRCTAGRGASG